MDAQQNHLRAQLGNAVRHGRDREAAALRRQFRLSRAETGIRLALEVAPEDLAEAERAQLAGLVLAGA